MNCVKQHCLFGMPALYRFAGEIHVISRQSVKLIPFAEDLIDHLYGMWRVPTMVYKIRVANCRALRDQLL